MESSGATPFISDGNWSCMLDSLMLAAGYGHGPIATSLLDPTSTSSTATCLTPLMYQHFFHRPQNQMDFMTYHAANLQQHLAIAAASADHRLQKLQLPVEEVRTNRSDSETKMKTTKIGYSVAQLLGNHQQDSGERITTYSPHNSGIYLLSDFLNYALSSTYRMSHKSYLMTFKIPRTQKVIWMFYRTVVLQQKRKIATSILI
jgi:hypothetical protein